MRSLCDGAQNRREPCVPFVTGPRTEESRERERADPPRRAVRPQRVHHHYYLLPGGTRSTTAGTWRRAASPCRGTAKRRYLRRAAVRCEKRAPQARRARRRRSAVDEAPGERGRGGGTPRRRAARGAKLDRSRSRDAGPPPPPPFKLASRSRVDRVRLWQGSFARRSPCRAWARRAPLALFRPPRWRSPLPPPHLAAAHRSRHRRRRAIRPPLSSLIGIRTRARARREQTRSDSTTRPRTGGARGGGRRNAAAADDDVGKATHRSSS